MENMTPQRWLALAAGLVSTALSFLISAPGADAIPTIVFLLLGLASALLSFATAFFTGVTQVRTTLRRKGRLA